MIKPTTLKKKIEEVLPQSIRLFSTAPEKWDQMNEQEKLLIFQSTKSICHEDLELRRHEDKLFVNIKRVSIRRIGNRLFPKRTTINIIYIQGNIIKVKDTAIFNGQFKLIMQLFGILWTENLKPYEYYFISKPSILKSVLTGRVYSEESLIRKIASHIFRVGDIEWREMKKYLKIQAEYPNDYISIFDIRDFTKNFNNSIRVLNRNFENHHLNRHNTLLLRDALNNAVILNKKIDLNWSEKRIHEEHKKMVKQIMMLSDINKSDKPIHPLTIEEEHIKMLNTEKKIFYEGVTMSHCVYVNYYQQILTGKYLVFHMSYPEVCTIGVLRQHGYIVLDQAYKFNNNVCKNETIRIIKGFIERNSEKMSSLLKENKEYAVTAPDELPF